MRPHEGELWEFTEIIRVSVGMNREATYSLSGPALVINQALSQNGRDYVCRILWGGRLETFSTLQTNRKFGKRIS